MQAVAVLAFDFGVVGNQKSIFSLSFDEFIGRVALLAQGGAEFHRAFGESAWLLALEHGKFTLFFQ